MENSTNYYPPKVQLTGTHGNVFALIGECKEAMRKANVPDKVISEMTAKVFACGSYHEALKVLCSYCDVS